MPFAGASYDPETLAMLERAFDDAWKVVSAQHPGRDASELKTTRKMLALKIMAAADEGERDPERLTALALRAVEGRDFY